MIEVLEPVINVILLKSFDFHPQDSLYVDIVETILDMQVSQHFIKLSLVKWNLKTPFNNGRSLPNIDSIDRVKRRKPTIEF